MERGGTGEEEGGGGRGKGNRRGREGKKDEGEGTRERVGEEVSKNVAERMRGSRRRSGVRAR